MRKKSSSGAISAPFALKPALDPNALDLGRSYYRLLAEKDPANIVIRYLLCDLNLRAYEKGQTADLPELDKLLNEIEQLGGQGPYWLYAKAIRTLVKSNKKDPKLLLEARGYLQDALKVRKDWAALAVLAGKICEMQDEPDQALEFYVNAIYRMRERDNDVIRRTLALLMPRGRIDEAGQLFDYLEKQKSPLLGEMRPQYALWKVYRGDIAAAEKEVDKSVPAGSKDYRDFLRQGQMYSVLADREKRSARIAYRNGKPDAEAEIKRASAAMIRLAQKGVNALLHAQDLEPKADDVWVSLFQLLVNVGQADKAQPLIDRAEAALKGENAPLTLAACCELMKGAYEVQAKAEEAAAANAQATNEDRAKALQVPRNSGSGLCTMRRRPKRNSKKPPRPRRKTAMFCGGWPLSTCGTPNSTRSSRFSSKSSRCKRRQRSPMPVGPVTSWPTSSSAVETSIIFAKAWR